MENYDLSKEQTVLGSLLSDPEQAKTLIPKLIKIFGNRGKTVFYYEKHQVIFQALFELHTRGDPLEIPALYPYLRKFRKDIPRSYLINLVTYDLTPITTEYYAKQLKELAIRREFKRVTLEASEKADNIIPTSTLIEKAYEQIGDLKEQVEPGERGYHLDNSILPASEFLKVKTPEKKTILTPWLKEKQIVLISGWRGVGKTWLALSLADAIARNRPFASWDIKNPVNWLYLDAEMAKPDLDERLRVLNPKQEWENCLYVYSSELANNLSNRRPLLAESEWQQDFQKFLIDNEIKLWVADNITSLTPGLDENVKAEWDSINQWLLELRFNGITTILIHHLGKEGTQRGTSAREDNIDISIELTHPAGYVETDGAKFEVKFTKTRLPLKDLTAISDLQLQLTEDEAGNAIWTHASIKKSKRKQILELLDQGYTQKQITDILEIDKGYVSKVKKEGQRTKLLTSEGKLTKLGFQELEKI